MLSLSSVGSSVFVAMKFPVFFFALGKKGDFEGALNLWMSE